MIFHSTHTFSHLKMMLNHRKGCAIKALDNLYIRPNEAGISYKPKRKAETRKIFSVDFDGRLF